MYEQQQFTPKMAISSVPQQYISSIPIYQQITPQKKQPESAYKSPSKAEREQQLIETLNHQPLESQSYFLQRNQEKQQGPMPDYAKFLTEAPISAGHIQQPLYEPPVFVPAYPPQTAMTQGRYIRQDNYVEIGKAPSKVSPVKRL